MKRLVLCLDGTWNKPDEEGITEDQRKDTNVFLFHQSVLPADDQGVRQDSWYNAGVGSTNWDKVVGGAFGTGLDLHIINAYRHLMEAYEDGDEVYVVGFSRGAYAARSLVGLMNYCGLANVDPAARTGTGTDNVEQAMGRDEAGKQQSLDVIAQAPEWRVALDAYRIYGRRKADAAASPEAEDFKNTRARVVPVRFLGVWDTVGALGVPFKLLSPINNLLHGFHDTTLSAIVENAFHALAIDEHRQAFAPTLWDAEVRPGQTMEQRWFVGAHSNVGGGYADQLLSAIPLRWMQDAAMSLGLKVTPVTLTDAHFAGPVADSYKDFLTAALSPQSSIVARLGDATVPGVKTAFERLRSSRLGGLLDKAASASTSFSLAEVEAHFPRFFRPMLATTHGNEVVDASVERRRRAKLDPMYAPTNQGLPALVAAVAGAS